MSTEYVGEEAISSKIASLESAYDQEANRYLYVEAISASLESSGMVDRMTMESLVQTVPDAISPNYPLNSYTTAPSKQNFEVSLESSAIGRMLIGFAIGAIIGKLLYSILNYFVSHDYEKTMEQIQRSQEERRRLMKEIEDTQKEQRALANIQLFATSNDNELYKEAPKASSVGNMLIKSMAPGSQVLNILSKWVDSFVDRMKQYVDRVDEYIDIQEKANGADADESKKLISRAQSATLSDKDSFLTATDELKSALSFTDGSSWSSVWKEEARGTKDYIEYLFGKTTWEEYFEDKILTSRLSDLDGPLKTLEKKAKELKEVLDKQKSTSSKSSTSTSKDEVIVTRSISGRNADLEKALKELADSIRAEGSKLVYFRGILSRAMEFYRVALNDKMKIMKVANRHLNKKDDD